LILPPPRSFFVKIYCVSIELYWFSTRFYRVFVFNEASSGSTRIQRTAETKVQFKKNDRERGTDLWIGHHIQRLELDVGRPLGQHLFLVGPLHQFSVQVHAQHVHLLAALEQSIVQRPRQFLIDFRKKK